jgi:hypothetical protein
MVEFHAEEWHSLSGRGISGAMAVVALDRDYERSAMLSELRRVKIDGREYDVRGIESQAIEHQRKGQLAGLLVGK